MMIDGPKNFKIGYINHPDHTLLGVVCHPKEICLGLLAITYWHTQFEDSSFTRTKDMKEDRKRRNSDLGWFASFHVTGNVTIQ